jgi:hypothetical protein
LELSEVSEDRAGCASESRETWCELERRPDGREGECEHPPGEAADRFPIRSVLAQEALVTPGDEQITDQKRPIPATSRSDGDVKRGEQIAHTWFLG